MRLRFVRQVAGTSLTLIWKAAAAMVAGIIVARGWGPAAKGTVSVLVALGTLAVLLGTFGLHQAGIYFLGRSKEDPDPVLANGVLTGVAGGVATACVLTLLAVGLKDVLLHNIRTGIFLLFVSSVPFSYLREFVQRLHLGLGRVMAYNAADIAEGIGLLGGTLVLVLLPGRSVGPLITLRVAIAVVTTVGLTAYLFRVHPFHLSPNVPLLRAELRYGVRNYAASLMWLALLQSDIILCNAFLGNARTGIYSVAVSLATSTTVLPGAVAPLLFQRVSAEDSRERRIANTNHVLRIMTLVMVVAVVALAVAASFLVTLLYGNQYQDATRAIQILCPGIFFASMANLVLSFMSGEGSPPVVYRAPLLGFLLNLGLNLYMIPTFGINGASITSTLGYLAAFLVLAYRYTRSTSSKASSMFIPTFTDLAVAFRGTSE